MRMKQFRTKLHMNRCHFSSVMWPHIVHARFNMNVILWFPLGFFPIQPTQPFSKRIKWHAIVSMQICDWKKNENISRAARHKLIRWEIVVNLLLHRKIQNMIKFFLCCCWCCEIGFMRMFTMEWFCTLVLSIALVRYSFCCAQIQPIWCKCLFFCSISFAFVVSINQNYLDNFSICF